MARERLPRGERLKGRDSYRMLMRDGVSVEDTYLIIRYLPQTEKMAHRRVGVAVSRHCRGAVARNRLRRRLRDIYRRKRDLLPPAGEFLLIARSDAQHASHLNLTRSFQTLSDELVKICS